MDMDKICNQCRLCSWIPKQDAGRPLLRSGVATAPILVLDSQYDGVFAEEVKDFLVGFFPRGSEFTYSNVVRCDSSMSLAQYQASLSKCSVWTNLLTEDASLILTVQTGLQQLKVQESHEHGDLFKHNRLGVVLVMPPIFQWMGRPKEVTLYQGKLQRAMHSIGMAATV